MSAQMARLSERAPFDRPLPGAQHVAPRHWPLALTFVAVAVANRVSNRVLLVPLALHTYVLALATSAVQVAAYGAWLCSGQLRGRVTTAMWRFARQHAALIVLFGACEGAFFPLVFYAAARLPGALVQVLNQILIPSTMVFSAMLLRRRYDRVQLAAVCAVLAGVLIASAPPASAGASAPKVVNVAFCAVAYILQALAMVVKELLFVRYAQQANARRRDARQGRKVAEEEQHPFSVPLFLALGTLARAVALLLGWPLFLQLGAPPGATTAASLRDSAQAGLRALASLDVLPLAAFYWGCNVGISATALLLVRSTSAAATVLANVVAMPLSALLFCCPLPLLERQPFHGSFAASLALVVAGNLLYSHKALRADQGDA